MNPPPRFTEDWEPALLEEQVVGLGSWCYQDEEEFSARLIRRKWDYSAADIEAIESNVHGIAIDYLDYNIGPDGNVFFWVFEGVSRDAKSRTSLPSKQLAHTSMLMRERPRSHGANLAANRLSEPTRGSTLALISHRIFHCA
ncbi:hypothetical protein [Ideonella sp.]|uniref:hypothetical protein n=1 Tax=Ideonella sp. TaxID=1929293 RepID=UPI003BB4FACC